jgi:cyclase
VRIVDLSAPIDAHAYEPDPIRHEVLSPREGALHMAAEMRTHFGIEFDPDVLPDGEFLSLDRLELTTHTGTHVDAPSHYGSRISYRQGRPRHIHEMPLEWFHGPGIVLDLSDAGVGVIDAARLEREFTRIGRTPAERDIVLLRTGADRHVGTPEYFREFAGLAGDAVTLLLDLGVRIIGTDAFSLDAPFGYIIDRYRETGDTALLWPAHVIGRHREYCQIERLANLGALPGPFGFTVSCFPVKIAGAGAGWTRAVAYVDN